MKMNLRTLSQQEARVVLGLEWQERRTVDREEIVLLLDGNTARAARVIHSLVKKQWLERIAPGRYLLIPADRGPAGVPETNALGVGKHLADPYYFSYTTAAAFHNFTPQSRGTVWIVTPRKIPERTIRGTTYRFVNLVGRKFFGYGQVTVYDEKVNLADREKTILDCVDKVKWAGGIGEVARMIVRAAPKLDWDKVAGYVGRFGSVALAQRLGYLATKTEVVVPPAARQRLHACLKRNSRSFLNPNGAKTSATYDHEWQVLVNVPEREILADL